MSSTRTTDATDTSLRAVMGAVALIGLVTALAAGALAGAPAMLSAGVGAAVAVGNLWLIARTVRGLLQGRGVRLPWGLVAVLKLTGLVAVLYWLVGQAIVDVVPLVIGYGALPLGIVASQLRPTPPATEKGPDNA